MAGFDRSAQRVIVAIALLVVVTWALRGHLPGVEPLAERQPPRSNPAATAVVIAMVMVAAAIMAIAIIVRLREPSMRRPPPAEITHVVGTARRPSWRLAVVALIAVICWLLLILLLSRIDGHPPDAVPPAEGGPPPAEAPPPVEPRPPTELPDPNDTLIGYLMPPMIALMVLVVIASVITQRRQRRAAPPPPTTAAVAEPAPVRPPPGDSLVRAAERGLAEIGDLSREPREAIIACYAAMERELTRVPGAMPQDCDTPSEVLARAVDLHALRADSATELVDLFEEARFSPHVMTEVHRDAALRVLRRVQSELSAPSSGSGA